MKVVPTKLPEVKLVYPDIFKDSRGYFLESFHAGRYAEAGIEGPFLQDNISRSARGTLRGLHFQQPNAQGKLVSVIQGRIFDVAVDIRIGSANFGKWEGVELSEEDHAQLWVPEGFAHGFLALSDETIVTYKCTSLYSPESEHTLIWNDDAIGINWPEQPTSVSPKDLKGKTLADLKISGVLPKI